MAIPAWGGSTASCGGWPSPQPRASSWESFAACWRCRPRTPGLIEDLKTEHIDTKLVPKVVAVSAVSLIGGASLGPEVALGQMGGGTGAYIAERRELDDDMTKELTLSGMGGAFGGLFSSPLMATILVLEIAQPPRNRFGNSFYGTLVASATSLGIYFAIAGSVFLGLYEVPQYDYEDWHLLAGVGLGLFAAFVVIVTLVVAAMTKRLLGLVKIATVPLAVIGGLVFGLVGVMLPLTNFTGSDQLATVVSEASTLGTGLLIATLVGKMFTFAVSSATGFIGGPIFPMLFIGGTGHHRQPHHPRRAARTCVHLHVGRRARFDRRRAILAGAVDRAAHPGGGHPDLTYRDRRRDLLPDHLRTQIRRDETPNRTRTHIGQVSINSPVPIFGRVCAAFTRTSTSEAEETGTHWWQCRRSFVELARRLTSTGYHRHRTRSRAHRTG